MGNRNQYFQEANRLSKNPFFFSNNLLAPKGLSAAYLRYRIVRPLLKGYYKAFKKFHPGSPWTSQASILFFEKMLTQDMTGFEYGSGLSTLFFAKRLKHLVSVEHQPEWHHKVQSLIREANLQNVEYHLIPPDNATETSKVGNTPYFSDDTTGGDPKEAFPYNSYTQFITQFSDASFDFILVDGRARVACSLHALSKLKPGGIFVLDNSERERYALVHQMLADWPCVNTSTGLTDTTLWFKP